MSDPEKKIELSTKLQDCSLEIMRAIIKGVHIDSEDMKEPPVSLAGHWATMIHMESKASKMQFVCAFREEEVAPYAEEIFKKQGEVNLTLVLDMMKEFCNQTGGYIKHIIQMGKGSYVLSVPFAAQANNIPDLTNISSGDFEQIWWKVSAPNLTLYCNFQSIYPEGDGHLLYSSL